MTTHVVADDVLGSIARKRWELDRRLMEGSLDPFLVSIALQQIIEGKFLFDDLFAHFKKLLLPLDKQLEKIRYHNENTWNGAIPELWLERVDVSSDHKQSVTDLELLHVEGHSADNTVAMLWSAIVAETPDLEHKIKMPPEPLRLHAPELLTPHHTRPCIRKVRLDLVAHWDKKIGQGLGAKEIRGDFHPVPQEVFAHGEVLSALAWHPGLIYRMDGKNFPFMDLAGYDLKVNEETRIPYVCRNRTGELELSEWHGTEHDPRFSAPVVLDPVPKEFRDSEPEEA